MEFVEAKITFKNTDESAIAGLRRLIRGEHIIAVYMAHRATGRPIADAVERAVCNQVRWRDVHRYWLN